MFEPCLDRPTTKCTWWSVGLALLGQVAAVGILVLIPMFYLQTLPVPRLPVTLLAPLLPPSPPPAPESRRRAQQAASDRFAPRKFVFDRSITPAPVAEKTPVIAQAPPTLSKNLPAGGVAGGIPGGVPGYIGGAIGGIPNVPPPPTPSAPKVAKSAEPASPVSPQRIRVGGQVQAALLIHEVQPLYPKLALQARISGTVRLKAVIGPDGSVQQLNFMSGPPLLVQAAMEAVQHWEYKPTYLNGRPVEVATEIDVHFTLTS